MRRMARGLDDALAAYAVDHTRPADDVERALAARTAELGGVAGMQIGHDQVVFFTLLTQLVGARHAVEVGTFTGMSALAIAKGLPADGRLVCCDVSDEWTAIGREAWTQAGVADRIDLRIGPALDTLRAMPTDPVIDLAFIDADKPNYIGYHDELVPRLRPGGLLLVDNVLWSGQVLDGDATDANTVALRAYNDHAAADPRVEGVIVPIGDGVFVLRRTDA